MRQTYSWTEPVKRLIKPDGSIVQVTWTRIVPYAEGIRTVYPIIPLRKI